MKLLTWNVNSVRLRLERLLAVLARHRPDVVCLQELKSTEESFPFEALRGAGYYAAVWGQPGYNGVAVLSREEPEAVQRSFPGDPAPQQARALVVDLAGGGPRVVCLYVVNGQKVGSDAYALKLAWLDALAAWIAAAHTPETPLVLAGDFNIAPEPRDVYDPALWHGRVLFSEPERAHLKVLLDWGLRDLLRLHTDAPGIHTWWDYRMGAFHRGWGLRLDLVLGTAPVAAGCREVRVDREERKPTAGPGKPSDHAPVIAVLERTWT